MIAVDSSGSISIFFIIDRIGFLCVITPTVEKVSIRQENSQSLEHAPLYTLGQIADANFRLQSHIWRTVPLILNTKITLGLAGRRAGSPLRVDCLDLGSRRPQLTSAITFDPHAAM